jgi:hypothetical protein
MVMHNEPDDLIAKGRRCASIEAGRPSHELVTALCNQLEAYKAEIGALEHMLKLAGHALNGRDTVIQRALSADIARTLIKQDGSRG